MTKNMNHSNRNVGLDLVRILAILFLLLCFLPGFDKRKAMLSATILIILISLALRIYTVMTHPEIQWDDEIRK